MCRDWAEEVRNITNNQGDAGEPGAHRTRMRAEAAPGEDPMTIPAPHEITPHLVAMAAPDWQETGKIFDFPRRAVLNFRAPA